jgi:uncharacterized protein YbbC (DUF1343 family)
MTIGELAKFFNEEYQIGSKLSVIPMKGWKRYMTFDETDLQWIPASPHIPEQDTPFYYATTGILGELELFNIGVGYTLPFKIVGAPWINGAKLAKILNEQKFPGVKFSPFYFRPFYGSFKNLSCEGVLINIVDKRKFKPLSAQYLILGVLKSLYPEKIEELLKKSDTQKKLLFSKASGTNKILSIFEKEKYATWKLITLSKKNHHEFLDKRKKYLFPQYE